MSRESEWASKMLENVKNVMNRKETLENIS